MSEAPSWSWQPDRRSTAGADRRLVAGRPPATLIAGVAGMGVLVGAEVAQVVGRDDLTVALRVALVVLLATQVVLAALALRRSAPAVMVLLLCAVTAFATALAGGLGDARVVLAAVAVAVVALLGRSLRWFPGYEL